MRNVKSNKIKYLFSTMHLDRFGYTPPLKLYLMHVFIPLCKLSFSLRRLSCLYIIN